MPQYEYKCRKCEHEFTLHVSVSEHIEKDRKHEVRCPKCDSNEVKHVIESVYVTTSKKS